MLVEINITTNYRIEKGIAPIAVNILFGLNIKCVLTSFLLSKQMVT